MAGNGQPAEFGGVSLLRALAVILALAVLAPPGGATLVNRWRIDRADRDVRRLAEALRAMDRLRRDSLVGDILVGPGTAPEAPGLSEWRDGYVVNLDGSIVESLGPDPWGNRYHVTLGAGRPNGAEGALRATAGWVLSAGPNGLIETPYAVPADASALHGDDIGARVE